MDILKKPLVTEKMSAMNEKGRYGFFVDPKANKVEIRKAVEALYGVTVESVNTMRYAGKKIRRHTKRGLVNGQQAHYKKAVVTLKEGDVIDFYSDVQ